MRQQNCYSWEGPISLLTPVTLLGWSNSKGKRNNKNEELTVC